MQYILQPWPWYVSGPLIGLIVPALLLLGNKTFGVSSSFRHVCAACVPARIPFFKYDWKNESWNLFFVGGIVAGGFIATQFLSSPAPLELNPKTVTTLQSLGVNDFSGLLPADIFGLRNLMTLRSLIFLVGGGFLVGFGTRYAGGCTSGHSIMGLSSMQWPSLVATICFMAAEWS